MLGLNLDLTEQLVFYGSYHNNKWNKLIHVIFVPLIVATAMVWLCYTGPYLALPSPVSAYVDFNAAAVVYLLYASYYTFLSPRVGGSFALVLFGMLVAANMAVRTHRDTAWQYATMLHVFSWWAQVHPGHALLEGRAPALKDSFVQSLVLAPLFVWYEVWFELGFFTELKEEVQRRVDDNIRTLYREKKKAP